MNRRDHLLKAEKALGQLVEHLKRAGEEYVAYAICDQYEDNLLALIEGEPSAPGPRKAAEPNG